MFSILRSYCSRGDSTRGARMRAFTLIEVLISAAIITIITSVVLFNFSAFNSTVILKSLAYEVAMSIREAQVYSVSVGCVANTSGTCTSVNDFRNPFGMTFTQGDDKYKLFRYTGNESRPYYDYDVGNAVNIHRYPLERSITISEVCVFTKTSMAGPPICGTGIERLDISFRRPEFTPIFYTTIGGVNQNDIGKAQIRLKAATGDEVWIVEVGTLGSISVFKG